MKKDRFSNGEAILRLILIKINIRIIKIKVYD